MNIDTKILNEMLVNRIQEPIKKEIFLSFLWLVIYCPIWGFYMLHDFLFKIWTHDKIHWLLQNTYKKIKTRYRWKEIISQSLTKPEALATSCPEFKWSYGARLNRQKGSMKQKKYWRKNIRIAQPWLSRKPETVQR